MNTGTNYKSPFVSYLYTKRRELPQAKGTKHSWTCYNTIKYERFAQQLRNVNIIRLRGLCWIKINVLGQNRRKGSIYKAYTIYWSNTLPWLICTKINEKVAVRGVCIIIILAHRGTCSTNVWRRLIEYSNRISLYSIISAPMTLRRFTLQNKL